MNERMLSRRLRGLILIGWTVLLAALAAAGLSPWDLHAQPVFRSASSSLTASPQFRNATSSASSIVFRAPGFQTAGIGSSITPAIPAGTQAGDFAVLIVAGRPASTTQPAAPAGWTLRSWSFREVGANDLAIMTFYRVLTGGDANPTVNFPAAWQGASAGASAQIAVWAGVDAAAPFDVPDVTGNSAPGVSWTPPSITTVTSGAWVVSAVATSDDNDLRVQASAEFTPRMLTVFYDTTQGGDHSVALADKVQGTPGTPAMLTWSQAVNQSDPWAGITFVLRPVSNITIPSPGPAHQDVMIASIAFSPSTAAVTAPAAWIQVRRIDNGAGTSNSLVVYRKTASSPEPDTYSWTLSGEVTAMAGGIQSFSGVDGTAVIDVENGEATPSGLTHSTPSVTTTTDNTLVVSSHTFSSSQPWTAPSGMTESFDIGSSTPPGSVGQSIAASRVLQPFAGATGIKTATAAGDPDTGNTHILALKPAQPTLTINRPSGTVLNDVMLAAIGVGGGLI